MRRNTLVLVSVIACFSLLVPALASMEAALDHLKSHEKAYNTDLIDLVSIPSISALPEHQPDMLKAADWLKNRLLAAGLSKAEVVPNPKGPRPAVFAEHISHNPSAPTILIYGHYDVQPAEPLEAWTTPPFKPEVREGAMFGRGASDDKGGVLGAIQAVEAVLATGGTLPVNVKFFIEGEEEIGSPYLEPFLEAYKDLLSADYGVSADGGQPSETQPGIVLGLRGQVALELEVSALSRDVHSGFAGGAVQNAARALVQLLSTLHDPETHKVAVKGFYDKVRNITDQDRDDILAFNYDEQTELMDRIGAVEPLGEAGFSTLERIWLRPTLEILGINSGFTGQGIKTAIPAKSIAKLSARIVPNQTPDEVLQLIRDHVTEHMPPACNVTVRALAFSASAYSGARESPVNTAAARVLEKVVGKKPLFERNGATIPALAAMQHHLKIDTTAFGFALGSDQVHAPNERYKLSQYRNSREAYLRLFFEIEKEFNSSVGSDKTEL